MECFHPAWYSPGSDKNLDHASVLKVFKFFPYFTLIPNEVAASLLTTHKADSADAD